jgi:sulfide:quinone oxidoreductase
MKRVIVLGAGTAGTMMANKLVRALHPARWQVTLVDRDDEHLYQPGLIFLPFGDVERHGLVRPRRATVAPEVDLRLDGVSAIEPDKKRIRLGTGAWLVYDLLVLATGTRIVPDETPGLTGHGWQETAFDFYTLDGALALRKALAGFDKGRVVVNLVDMPIKCPVAPLEITFLLESHFARRGTRDDIEIVFATPLDGAFTKPKASAVLGDLMGARNIKVETDFMLTGVDGERRVMQAADGRELDYDLLVTVPLHRGSQVVDDSELGDDLGFFPTDKHTLKSTHHEDIFAIGDATNVPTSKAGSVAHFMGEVLFENVLSHAEGHGPVASFDGHANCFIESGYDRAILIDFNYDHEPLPGKFPLPGLGPFTLLGESRMNHWGKLMFEWAYWNLLLEGRDLPIGHEMSMLGKWRDVA